VRLRVLVPLGQECYTCGGDSAASIGGCHGAAIDELTNDACARAGLHEDAAAARPGRGPTTEMETATTARGMGTEVHIWIDCVDGRPPLDESLGLLDDEERARAGHFRRERDRARFVARRAFRRRILARYLGLDPAAVPIRTSPSGRPEVESADDLTFSTSHSNGLAVVAVGRGARMGVDIEQVRPVPDAVELAERLFSRRESEHLRALDATTSSEAFLTVWTRKESCVKAVGAGLSMPLDGFDVLTPDADGEVRPHGLSGDAPFVLRGLDGIDGYVGAVAVSGTDIVTRRMSEWADRP
jgi:4'-phosphopantetheinyl transferase